MSPFRKNVGRFDALSRRVIAVCALLGGLVSLEGFFGAMGFLSFVTWAFILVTGFFYLIPGLRGGTAIFGFLLIAVTVADGWLALRHEGQWALLLGVAVAAVGLATAGMGWCAMNAMLGWDTHHADPIWQGPPHVSHS